MKQGFAHILLIIFGVTIAVFGLVYFKSLQKTPYTNTNPTQASTSTATRSAPKKSEDTTNWKTYKSKDNLYQLSYPGNWTVNDTNDVSMGYKAIDISIIKWNDGSKQYVEQQWQSVPCAPGSDGNGCAPFENKEIKKLSIGGNTVYWKIDGNGQMHALIPNSRANKTVEIYSGSSKDKNLFDQILSTFKFLN